MAAGPFLGAAILGGLDVDGALNGRPQSRTDDPIRDLLAPSWRWVFYLNVPIGMAALLIAWAASAGWETPRRGGGVDVLGAAVWSVALGAGLAGRDAAREPGYRRAQTRSSSARCSARSPLSGRS